MFDDTADDKTLIDVPVDETKPDFYARKTCNMFSTIGEVISTQSFTFFLAINTFLYLRNVLFVFPMKNQTS